MLKKALHILFIQLVFANFLFGQGLGNGTDGSPNVSGIVNSYTYLVANTSKCDVSIQVNNTSIFSVNDLILIIQMQGATIIDSNNASYGQLLNENNAGNFEYSKVKSIEGNIIFLATPLLRVYSISGNTQVIRVPQYDNPTITDTLKCPKWNGKIGGVLAIDVLGILTMSENIDVSSTGFRGGVVINGPAYVSDSNYIVETPSLVGDAPKGEGIAFDGVAPFTSGKGAPANAGGGGNSHTAGGGGGANFGCGGKGGWGYPVDGFSQLSSGLGGNALPYSNLQNKIYMGGGGGAGSTHANEGTDGGNGGGIVFITANNIEGNGFAILAKGDSSLSSFSNFHADGIGAGGAGGSVVLSTNTISTSLTMNVDGGDGGESPQIGSGPGAGGGGGLVWFSNSSTPSQANVTFNGGVAGKANGTFYGATNGCDGGILFNVILPLNTISPLVSASFTFLEQTALSYNFINTSTNGNTYLWSFGDGFSDTTFTVNHTYNQMGIFPITLTATDTGNCRSTVQQILITNVANVFTPNGDGMNDFFSFNNYLDDNFELKMEIFNRWGKLIFEGDNNNTSWDGQNSGKEVSAGTYFYIINISEKEDSDVNLNPEQKVFKGTITLLR